ncbi:MAG: formylglycine-generating enzyme family protein, partial [Caldilineaceae bacterium]|nr:formylglycine-generating enzyme family protein [Caldilineaceae bacterium]
KIWTVILSILAWTVFQSRDALFEIILSEELYGPGKDRLLPWVQEQWRRYAGRVDAAEVAPASPLPTPTVESPLPTPEPSPVPRPRISAPYPEWTPVPAGWFWMGSDPRQDGLARSNEQPQHRVRLGAYRIGKYPVTNAQYYQFVVATGREPPGHWEAGRPPDDLLDHPVINVTWHDAVAYCKWLGRQLGRQVRLPSEAEWEKAARGTDGWVYPWGNQPPNDRLCNFNMNVGGTTPVGRYPAGRSPYGCYDMAGNVWEWTSSLWGKDVSKPEFSYPYDPNDGREDMRAGNDVLRVVRGGSWYLFDDDVRCAVRGGSCSSIRYDFVGFRVMSPGL